MCRQHRQQTKQATICYALSLHACCFVFQHCCAPQICVPFLFHAWMVQQPREISVEYALHRSSYNTTAVRLNTFGYFFFLPGWSSEKRLAGAGGLFVALCPGIALDPQIKYNGTFKRGKLEKVFEAAAKSTLKTMGDEGQMVSLDRLQVINV